jgi:anthraniloyl-CoA monooxygenase
MRIVCVGGGPAGLYLAILLKQADQHHRVTVLERKPQHCGDGWGVVFWDDLLADLDSTDPETAQLVRERARRWQGQHLVLDGERIEHEGRGYGIARSTLLDVLAQRATDVGVDLQFDSDVVSASELDADVIVASDGANSIVRQGDANQFGTHVDVGRNMYVWLGTNKMFDAFTFAFAQTDAGWIWFHAYAFDDCASTCIVECASDTWKGLGFDTRSAPDSIALLEKIFSSHLDGQRLISPRHDVAALPWLKFKTVTNERWHTDKTVLVGDAAHTTHFSIGSGTRLAFEDAIALADALQHAATPQAAFAAYEQRRRAALRSTQHDACRSAQWFEEVTRYTDLAAPAFFALLRARRDPVLPHVPPRLYYALYAPVERSPALRNLRQRIGPTARAFYNRLGSGVS